MNAITSDPFINQTFSIGNICLTAAEVQLAVCSAILSMPVIQAAANESLRTLSNAISSFSSKVMPEEQRNLQGAFQLSARPTYSSVQQDWDSLFQMTLYSDIRAHLRDTIDAFRPEDDVPEEMQARFINFASSFNDLEAFLRTIRNIERDSYALESKLAMALTFQQYALNDIEKYFKRGTDVVERTKLNARTQLFTELTEFNHWVESSIQGLIPTNTRMEVQYKLERAPTDDELKKWRAEIRTYFTGEDSTADSANVNNLIKEAKQKVKAIAGRVKANLIEQSRAPINARIQKLIDANPGSSITLIRIEDTEEWDAVLTLPEFSKPITYKYREESYKQTTHRPSPSVDKLAKELIYLNLSDIGSFLAVSSLVLAATTVIARVGKIVKEHFFPKAQHQVK